MKKNKKNRARDDDDEKPKNEIYTEGDLIDKSLMHRAEFLCFLPQDAIYYVNRNNLLDKELALVMRKMLGELNYLLYLTFQEFWATVLYNPSLKKCLESCLTYFSKRKYNQYLREDLPFPEVKDNEVAELQEHLFNVVLTLYYRVLYGDQENPDLWKKFKLAEEIYNQWIFDMPKLFDFMDVYAKDNRDIVLTMIQRVFAINGDYRLDFRDIVEQLSKHVLQRVFERLKIINDREEFDDGLNEAEIRRKTEVMLTLKDTLSALMQAFEFFPPEVSTLALADFRLLQFCENIFYEMYNGYKNWKLGDFAVQYHPIMDSIVEDTVELWVTIFTRFRQLLFTREVSTNNLPVKEIVASFKSLVGRFGTVLSLGTKSKDKKRNLMLLERIIQRWDVEGFIIELGEDALEKKDIDPALLESFLLVVVGIKQLIEKRNKPTEESAEQPQKGDADQEQAEEQEYPEEPEEPEQVQEVKPQQIGTAPPVIAKQPSVKPKPLPKVSLLTREQQQLKKRNLARQYDDDYDDVADYNRRMHDRDSSDDTESDGSELVNPNHQNNEGDGDKRTGQSFRGGRGGYRRGGRNQQPNKRGEQRHFDNPKVIEERNRQPREERPPAEKKYVEVKRNDEPRRNQPTGDNTGGKKKYRQK